MKTIKALLFWVPAALLSASCGSNLASPNGKLTAEVDAQTVSVYYRGAAGAEKSLAARIHLGMVTKEADLDTCLTPAGKSGKRRIVEEYTMLSGKRRLCRNEATSRT